MAETLPYSPQRNTFMDVLRTLALVGGAGLSADPRGRPIGQMLTAGGLLMAQGVDRRRDRTINSALAQMRMGDTDLPGAQRMLAERGLYTPQVDKMLQGVADQQRVETLRGPLFEALTQRRPEPVESPYPFGAPPASQGTSVPFMRPPQGPLSAEELRGNLKELYEKRGGGALLALGGFGGVTEAFQEEDRQTIAQAKARVDAAKAAREREKDLAAGQLFMLGAAGGTPEQVAAAKARSLMLGEERDWVTNLGNPASDISQNIRTYLWAMGVDPNKPTEAFPSQVQAAIDQYEYAQRRRLIAEKEAMARLELEGQWQKIIGENAALKYVHVNTLRNPDPNMTRGQLRDGPYVAMDVRSQNQLRGLRGVEAILNDMMTITEGGIVSRQLARRLGIPEGTVLPSLFSGETGAIGPAPEDRNLLSLYERAKRGTALYIDAVLQNLNGVRANVYESLKEGFLAKFSRMIGEERGHVTEGDVKRARELFAILMPFKGGFLPDTAPQARAKFSQLWDLLRDQYARGVGLNEFKEFNDKDLANLPDPPRRRMSGEVTYKDKGSKTPARTSGASAPTPPQAPTSPVAPTSPSAPNPSDPLNRGQNALKKLQQSR